MLSRRAFVTAGTAGLLLSRPAVAAASAAFHAHVGDIPAERRATAGTAYPSLTAALAAAPADGTPWRILLGATRLIEKVTIDRPRVSITGLSPTLSQIAFDDWAGRSDGNGGSIGARRAATLTITAPHVRLDNLTVASTFDYLGQMALPKTDPKKLSQAFGVVLMVGGQADEVMLQNVTLDGWMDTAGVDSGRVLLKDCHIFGTVDMFFGAATVALQSCRLTSRRMPPRTEDGHQYLGFICASATPKAHPYGFVFFDCVLDHEGEPFPDDSVTLARPLRPTVTRSDGDYGDPDVQSACLYVRCAFGDHIALSGWNHMSYVPKGGGRAYSEPDDARFYISGCTGKAAAAMPPAHIAPEALVAGLTPEKVLDLKTWSL